ncbi:MAG: DUF2442 domain-containing protein [Candidatus Kuenenia sp.]|nr:DUF2442 domain-containing protein [Candidatus Kuenenia sp.]
MLPKLQKAKYQGDYRIWLKFADGIEGEVDLEKELWGEMFLPLKDKVRFSGFSLDKELETIVWPNGADFAPEFLYQQLCPNYALKPTPKS